MIRYLALISVIATPAIAQMMDADACRQGWVAFNEITDQTTEMTAIEPAVTHDGWCRVDDSFDAVTAKDFGALQFRASGVGEAVAQRGVPETLNLTIEGIDLLLGWGLDLPDAYGGPRGRFTLDFMRDPQTRDAELEKIEADFGGLGRLLMRARGGGIDLSSDKSMQLTLGGARLNEVMLQLQTTPVLSAGLLSNLPVRLLQDIVVALPQTSITAQDRNALLAFLEAGPNAAGLLRIDAQSEQGIGILQMVVGVGPLEDKTITQDTLPGAMEVLFSGVTLTVDWVPFD